MFTLRCTQKLLKRMHLTPDDLKQDVAQPPTTAMGDWYAHLLILQRQQIALLVNEHSRLCVLISARDMDRLTERFHDAVIDLFRTIAISDEAIARERLEMSEMRYGLTTGTANGRSVLGSMNDYTNALRNSDLAERSLFDWTVYFSNWMCGPLGYKHPADVARQLLNAAVSETLSAK